MRILIFPNFDKEAAKNCTDNTIDTLLVQGITPVLTDEVKKTISRDDVIYLPQDEALKTCDFILTIGGDGTFIRTARLASAYRKPIFGINAGRLGFLTELECGVSSEIERLIKGDYEIRNTMMLRLHVEKESGEIIDVDALNEVVLRNSYISRLIDTDLFCDGHFVDRYRGDGVILFTPTGSTAYALSAGGPVVSPSIETIGLVPICAHSLYARSILFDSSSVISISPIDVAKYNSFGGILALVADGTLVTEVHAGDKVLIYKSPEYVKTVSFGSRFFEVMNQKFKGRD